jgi:hypothetical protein
MMQMPMIAAHVFMPVLSRPPAGSVKRVFAGMVTGWIRARRSAGTIRERAGLWIVAFVQQRAALMGEPAAGGEDSRFSARARHRSVPISPQSGGPRNEEKTMPPKTAARRPVQLVAKYRRIGPGAIAAALLYARRRPAR